MSLNIILITGASSGMGRETARQLDKIYTDKIDEIWLIARRRNRLEELANELSHPCHILEMDLADRSSYEKLDAELKLLDCKIKFLVNAAGFGVAGKFTENALYGNRVKVYARQFENTSICLERRIRSSTRLQHICRYEIFRTKLFGKSKCGA